MQLVEIHQLKLIQGLEGSPDANASVDRIQGPRRCITTHQLRHTAIATINDATGDLRMAQDFAGHARPDVTARYTRVREDRLRQAANILNQM